MLIIQYFVFLCQDVSGGRRGGETWILCMNYVNNNFFLKKLFIINKLRYFTLYNFWTICIKINQLIHQF